MLWPFNTVPPVVNSRHKSISLLFHIWNHKINIWYARYLMYKTCGGVKTHRLRFNDLKQGEINKTEHFINSTFACLINTKYHDYWENTEKICPAVRKCWHLDFYSESSNLVSETEKSVRYVRNVNKVVPPKMNKQPPPTGRKELNERHRTHLPLTRTPGLLGSSSKDDNCRKPVSYFS